MPILITQKDQIAATGRDIKHFNNGVSAIDMLMSEFGGGVDLDSTLIYINADRVTFDDSELMCRKLSTHDRVTVINEVKEPSTIAYIAVAVVAAAVAVALAPKPKIPNSLGEQKQSPNNQLSGQSNIARTYQSWPLILGSPISYPDLIGEAIEEYSDNIKQVEQYFFVGFGQFNIAQVRTGQTPIYNFPSASYTDYQPVNLDTVLPDYMTSFALEEVDGQILKAPNESEAGEEYTSTIDETQANLVNEFSKTGVLYVVKNASTDALKAEFDSVGSFNASIEYIINVLVVSQGEDTYVPQFVTGSGSLDNVELIGVNYKLSFSGFNGPRSDDGIYPSGATTISTGLSGQVNNINTPVECEEFWLNFSMQRGLKATVNVDITITQLDSKSGAPIGGANLTQVSYTSDTLTPQFRTVKITPASGKGWYKVSVKRTNNSTQLAENPDETRIEKVQCINRYTNKSFGNGTVLKVNIPATENAASTRSTKINLSLSALAPTYDVIAGAVDTTLRSSRKMADAVLHMHTNYYNRDASELDLNELYEIQNRLDAISPLLAQFDFTFDDNDISYQDRLDTILNVARCYSWNDGDKVRFRRDEAAAYPVALIGRRDISQESRQHSITYDTYLASDFNGVRIEYVDRLTNKKAYIYRAIDASGLIVNDTSSNPRTLELAGCQSKVNAENRANLEIRKMIYQRETLTETCLRSCSLLERGDVVLYAEQYESNVSDGEILAVNGTIATTSENTEFKSGVDYSVYFTSIDGDVNGPFDVSPVLINGSFKFECASLANAFVRDSVLGYAVQTGSRYLIVEKTNNQSKWTITSKQVAGGLTDFTMLNYDDNIYDFAEI